MSSSAWYGKRLMSLWMGSVVGGGSCVYSAADRSVVDSVDVMRECVMVSVVVSVGSMWWKNGIMFSSD